MSNIKVAVRVRPINEKEEKLGGRPVIEVRGNIVSIRKVKPNRPSVESLRTAAEGTTETLKHFSFDFAFASSCSGLQSTSSASPLKPYSDRFPEGDEGRGFSSFSLEGLESVEAKQRYLEYLLEPNTQQEALYQEVGSSAEVAVVDGYNACILAYGQSGSGKTYTVLGCQDTPGLSPRICRGLLQRLEQRWFQDLSAREDFSLFLSLVEIYKERVRDLLTDVRPSRSLRVREHPATGPYVDGVSWHKIRSVEAAWSLLEQGRSCRSVGPTSVHPHSSRSHALLTLQVNQPAIRTKSSLTLVDLAGSERANETTDKNRLKEGASINRSLVTLGNVISALAGRGQYITSPKGRSISCPQIIQRTATEEGAGSWGCPGPPPTPKRKKWLQEHGPGLPFIPYRDSVLTWLLKDTLGGNSETFMVATVSPSSTCYKETLSTLRYASRARRIVNRPVVNVDASVLTLSGLQQEVQILRRLLYEQTQLSLERERLANTEEAHDSKFSRGLRRRCSTAEGEYERRSDVIVASGTPYLINTVNDEFSDSIIIYHIQKGSTVVGKGRSCDLRVTGEGVSFIHFQILFDHARIGVILRALSDGVTVDEVHLVKGKSLQLRDGDTIRLGSREFTFHHSLPSSRKKKRPTARHTLLSSARAMSSLSRPRTQCHRKSKSISLPLGLTRSPRIGKLSPRARKNLEQRSSKHIHSPRARRPSITSPRRRKYLTKRFTLPSQKKATARGPEISSENTSKAPPTSPTSGVPLQRKPYRNIPMKEKLSPRRISASGKKENYIDNSKFYIPFPGKEKKVHSKELRRVGMPEIKSFGNDYVKYSDSETDFEYGDTEICRISPVGASHSEENVSGNEPFATDSGVAHLAATSSCSLLGMVTEFTSDTDSYFEQESIRPKIKGYNWNLNLHPTAFNLDTVTKRKGWFSETATPITSPQSPRFFRMGVGQESHKQLWRNNSVPELCQTQDVKRSVPDPNMQQYADHRQFTNQKRLEEFQESHSSIDLFNLKEVSPTTKKSPSSKVNLTSSETFRISDVIKKIPSNEKVTLTVDSKTYHLASAYSDIRKYSTSIDTLRRIKDNLTLNLEEVATLNQKKEKIWESESASAGDGEESFSNDSLETPQDNSIIFVGQFISPKELPGLLLESVEVEPTKYIDEDESKGTLPYDSLEDPSHMQQERDGDIAPDSTSTFSQENWELPPSKPAESWVYENKESLDDLIKGFYSNGQREYPEREPKPRSGSLDSAIPKSFLRKLMRKKVERRLPPSSSSDESDSEKKPTKKKKRSKSISNLTSPFSEQEKDRSLEFPTIVSSLKEYSREDHDKASETKMGKPSEILQLFQEACLLENKTPVDLPDDIKTLRSSDNSEAETLQSHKETIAETDLTSFILEQSSRNLLQKLGFDPDSPSIFSLVADVKGILKESSKKLVEFSLASGQDQAVSSSPVIQSPRKAFQSITEEVIQLKPIEKFAQEEVHDKNTQEIEVLKSFTKHLAFVKDISESSEGTSNSSGKNSPTSDASTEASWEELALEDSKSVELQSIVAPKRHLYTIAECSESSQTEGMDPQSDIIPSDWKDSCSEAEYGSLQPNIMLPFAFIKSDSHIGKGFELSYPYQTSCVAGDERFVEDKKSSIFASDLATLNKQVATMSIEESPVTLYGNSGLDECQMNNFIILYPEIKALEVIDQLDHPTMEEKIKVLESEKVDDYRGNQNSDGTILPSIVTNIIKQEGSECSFDVQDLKHFDDKEKNRWSEEISEYSLLLVPIGKECMKRPIQGKDTKMSLRRIWSYPLLGRENLLDSEDSKWFHAGHQQPRKSHSYSDASKLNKEIFSLVADNLCKDSPLIIKGSYDYSSSTSTDLNKYMDAKEILSLTESTSEEFFAFGEDGFRAKKDDTSSNSESDDDEYTYYENINIAKKGDILYEDIYHEDNKEQSIGLSKCKVLVAEKELPLPQLSEEIFIEPNESRMETKSGTYLAKRQFVEEPNIPMETIWNEGTFQPMKVRRSSLIMSNIHESKMGNIYNQDVKQAEDMESTNITGKAFLGVCYPSTTQGKERMNHEETCLVIPDIIYSKVLCKNEVSVSDDSKKEELQKLRNLRQVSTLKVSFENMAQMIQCSLTNYNRLKSQHVTTISKHKKIGEYKTNAIIRRPKKTVNVIVPYLSVELLRSLIKQKMDFQDSDLKELDDNRQLLMNSKFRSDADGHLQDYVDRLTCMYERKSLAQQYLFNQSRPLIMLNKSNLESSHTKDDFKPTGAIAKQITKFRPTQYGKPLKETPHRLLPKENKREMEKRSEFKKVKKIQIYETDRQGNTAPKILEWEMKSRPKMKTTYVPGEMSGKRKQLSISQRPILFSSFLPLNYSKEEIGMEVITECTESILPLSPHDSQPYLPSQFAIIRCESWPIEDVLCSDSVQSKSHVIKENEFPKMDVVELQLTSLQENICGINVLKIDPRLEIVSAPHIVAGDVTDDILPLHYAIGRNISFMNESVTPLQRDVASTTYEATPDSIKFLVAETHGLENIWLQSVQGNLPLIMEQYLQTEEKQGMDLIEAEQTLKPLFITGSKQGDNETSTIKGIFSEAEGKQYKSDSESLERIGNAITNVPECIFVNLGGDQLYELHAASDKTESTLVPIAIEPNAFNSDQNAIPLTSEFDLFKQEIHGFRTDYFIPSKYNTSEHETGQSEQMDKSNKSEDAYQFKAHSKCEERLYKQSLLPSVLKKDESEQTSAQRIVGRFPDGSKLYASKFTSSKYLYQSKDPDVTSRPELQLETSQSSLLSAIEQSDTESNSLTKEIRFSAEPDEGTPKTSATESKLLRATRIVEAIEMSVKSLMTDTSLLETMANLKPATMADESLPHVEQGLVIHNEAEPLLLADEITKRLKEIPAILHESPTMAELKPLESANERIEETVETELKPALEPDSQTFSTIAHSRPALSSDAYEADATVSKTKLQVSTSRIHLEDLSPFDNTQMLMDEKEIIQQQPETAYSRLIPHKYESQYSSGNIPREHEEVVSKHGKGYSTEISKSIIVGKELQIIYPTKYTANQSMEQEMIAEAGYQELTERDQELTERVPSEYKLVPSIKNGEHSTATVTKLEDVVQVVSEISQKLPLMDTADGLNITGIEVIESEYEKYGLQAATQSEPLIRPSLEQIMTSPLIEDSGMIKPSHLTFEHEQKPKFFSAGELCQRLVSPQMRNIQGKVAESMLAEISAEDLSSKSVDASSALTDREFPVTAESFTKHGERASIDKLNQSEIDLTKSTETEEPTNTSKKYTATTEHKQESTLVPPEAVSNRAVTPQMPSIPKRVARSILAEINIDDMTSESAEAISALTGHEGQDEKTLANLTESKIYFSKPLESDTTPYLDDLREGVKWHSLRDKDGQDVPSQTTFHISADTQIISQFGDVKENAADSKSKEGLVEHPDWGLKQTTASSLEGVATVPDNIIICTTLQGELSEVAETVPHPAKAKDLYTPVSGLEQSWTSEESVAEPKIIKDKLTLLLPTESYRSGVTQAIQHGLSISEDISVEKNKEKSISEKTDEDNTFPLTEYNKMEASAQLSIPSQPKTILPQIIQSESTSQVVAFRPPLHSSHENPHIETTSILVDTSETTAKSSEQNIGLQHASNSDLQSTSVPSSNDIVAASSSAIHGQQSSFTKFVPSEAFHIASRELTEQKVMTDVYSQPAIVSSNSSHDDDNEKIAQEPSVSLKPALVVSSKPEIFEDQYCVTQDFFLESSLRELSAVSAKSTTLSSEEIVFDKTIGISAVSAMSQPVQKAQVNDPFTSFKFSPTHSMKAVTSSHLPDIQTCDIKASVIKGSETLSAVDLEQTLLPSRNFISSTIQKDDVYSSKDGQRQLEVQCSSTEGSLSENLEPITASKIADVHQESCKVTAFVQVNKLEASNSQISNVDINTACISPLTDDPSHLKDNDAATKRSPNIVPDSDLKLDLASSERIAAKDSGHRISEPESSAIHIASLSTEPFPLDKDHLPEIFKIQRDVGRVERESPLYSSEHGKHSNSPSQPLSTLIDESKPLSQSTADATLSMPIETVIKWPGSEAIESSEIPENQSSLKTEEIISGFKFPIVETSATEQITSLKISDGKMISTEKFEEAPALPESIGFPPLRKKSRDTKSGEVVFETIESESITPLSQHAKVLNEMLLRRQISTMDPYSVKEKSQTGFQKAKTVKKFTPDVLEIKSKVNEEVKPLTKSSGMEPKPLTKSSGMEPKPLVKEKSQTDIQKAKTVKQLTPDILEIKSEVNEEVKPLTTKSTGMEPKTFEKEELQTDFQKPKTFKKLTPEVLEIKCEVNEEVRPLIEITGMEPKPFLKEKSQTDIQKAKTVKQLTPDILEIKSEVNEEVRPLIEIIGMEPKSLVKEKSQIDIQKAKSVKQFTPDILEIKSKVNEEVKPLTKSSGMEPKPLVKEKSQTDIQKAKTVKQLTPDILEIKSEVNEEVKPLTTKSTGMEPKTFEKEELQTDFQKQKTFKKLTPEVLEIKCEVNEEVRPLIEITGMEPKPLVKEKSQTDIQKAKTVKQLTPDILEIKSEVNEEVRPLIEIIGMEPKSLVKEKSQIDIPKAKSVKQFTPDILEIKSKVNEEVKPLTKSSGMEPKPLVKEKSQTDIQKAKTVKQLTPDILEIKSEVNEEVKPLTKSTGMEPKTFEKEELQTDFQKQKTFKKLTAEVLEIKCEVNEEVRPLIEITGMEPKPLVKEKSQTDIQKEKTVKQLTPDILEIKSEVNEEVKPLTKSTGMEPKTFEKEELQTDFQKQKTFKKLTPEVLEIKCEVNEEVRPLIEITGMERRPLVKEKTQTDFQKEKSVNKLTSQVHEIKNEVYEELTKTSKPNLSFLKLQERWSSVESEKESFEDVANQGEEEKTSANENFSKLKEKWSSFSSDSSMELKEDSFSSRPYSGDTRKKSNKYMVSETEEYQIPTPLKPPTVHAIKAKLSEQPAFGNLFQKFAKIEEIAEQKCLETAAITEISQKAKQVTEVINKFQKPIDDKTSAIRPTSKSEIKKKMETNDFESTPHKQAVVKSVPIKTMTKKDTSEKSPKVESQSGSQGDMHTKRTVILEKYDRSFDQPLVLEDSSMATFEPSHFPQRIQSLAVKSRKEPGITNAKPTSTKDIVDSDQTKGRSFENSLEKFDKMHSIVTEAEKILKALAKSTLYGLPFEEHKLDSNNTERPNLVQVDDRSIYQQSTLNGLTDYKIIKNSYIANSYDKQPFSIAADYDKGKTSISRSNDSVHYSPRSLKSNLAHQYEVLRNERHRLNKVINGYENRSSLLLSLTNEDLENYKYNHMESKQRLISPLTQQLPRVSSEQNLTAFSDDKYLNELSYKSFPEKSVSLEKQVAPSVYNYKRSTLTDLHRSCSYSPPRKLDDTFPRLEVAETKFGLFPDLASRHHPNFKSHTAWNSSENISVGIASKNKIASQDFDSESVSHLEQHQRLNYTKRHIHMQDTLYVSQVPIHTDFAGQKKNGCCVPANQTLHHTYCNSKILTPLPKKKPFCHSVNCFANTACAHKNPCRKNPDNNQSISYCRTKCRKMRSYLLNSSYKCSPISSPSVNIDTMIKTRYIPSTRIQFLPA